MFMMMMMTMTVSNRSVRRSASHSDLFVSRTRLQLGKRAFCVAGPVAWNSLSVDISSAPTLSTLKKHAQDTSFLT